MCGIVGAVSTRNIVPILVQGLQRLEYRGYDSCGVAVHAVDASGPGTRLQRLRGIARVADLAAQAESQPLAGHTGIAHTRWATHGVPAVTNAHPHVSRGPVPGGMGGDEAAARPARVQMQAARMKDGAILLEKVDLQGQGLSLNGSGSRNLLGGMSRSGRTLVVSSHQVAVLEDHFRFRNDPVPDFLHDVRPVRHLCPRVVLAEP